MLDSARSRYAQSLSSPLRDSLCSEPEVTNDGASLRRAKGNGKGGPMSLELLDSQRGRLRILRDEVAENDYVLTQPRIDVIQDELRQWPVIGEKDPSDKFFELFRLFEPDANTMDVTAWRGVCHWISLRHGCVHGLTFAPTGLAVLQQRAASVQDSPGCLDMTFSGHMGTRGVIDAARAEALEESGLVLNAQSGHMVDPGDLKHIDSYDYVEPPRPAEEFYNVERRFVFAIRITDKALESLSALDGEVAMFRQTTIDAVWGLLRGRDAASALRMSGPVALRYAAESWGRDWSVRGDRGAA